MTFTVVIPTRNRPGLALELLTYLRQTLAWSCPIVVIDQSDDMGRELGEALRAKEFCDIQHAYQDRRGTSAARNKGAKVAGSDWLIFFDDDVRPVKGYLEALTEFSQMNPWVDVVHAGFEHRSEWAAYVQNPEAWVRTRKSPEAGARRTYPLGWDAVQWFTSSPWSGTETLTLGIASGNFAVNRRAFLGVGGFDENIQGLGDDRELGLRLWWYGYRSCFFPGAVAFHLRAPHGGLRESRSSWQRLVDPEPPVGWIYFYLKWFPGKPYHQMLGSFLWKRLRQPWLLPVKLIRLFRSTTEARRRLRCGPRYMSTPMARAESMESTNPLQSVRAL